MRKRIFYDRISLSLTSGDGGKGNVSFQREKYIPKGMPDGGDGGDGGDVIFQVNSQLNHLAHLRYKRILKAGEGKAGQRKRASGKKGQDVVIEVPKSTQIKLIDSEKIIYEFSYSKEKLIFLKGGKGGKGNFYFKSSIRQNPTYAQKGLPGQNANIILEMKLLADIGLVGFPNVGKSTLLNALTNSNSPTSNYSFTTLSPHLGVYFLSDYEQLLISDIPGIIKQAHQGKGLGLHFLKHIEKTTYLFFLLDCASPNPYKDYINLQTELKQYNPHLLEKEFNLLITQVDKLSGYKKIINFFPQGIQNKIIFISSTKKIGFSYLNNLLRQIYDTIKK